MRHLPLGVREIKPEAQESTSVSGTMQAVSCGHAWLAVQTAGALGPEPVPALGTPRCWAGGRPENRQVVLRQAIFKSTVYTNICRYDVVSGRMVLRPQMRDSLQVVEPRMVWIDEQKLPCRRTGHGPFLEHLLCAGLMPGCPHPSKRDFISPSQCRHSAP